VCGYVFTMIAGRQFFADPRVVGRPLIVGDHGIFVREDLALARNLRTPSGAFKPSVVKFLDNPPPIRWQNGFSPYRQDNGQSSLPAWKRAVSAVRRLLRP
jgi:hypothetical protein